MIIHCFSSKLIFLGPYFSWVSMKVNMNDSKFKLSSLESYAWMLIMGFFCFNHICSWIGAILHVVLYPIHFDNHHVVMHSYECGCIPENLEQRWWYRYLPNCCTMTTFKPYQIEYSLLSFLYRIQWVPFKLYHTSMHALFGFITGRINTSIHKTWVKILVSLIVDL